MPALLTPGQVYFPLEAATLVFFLVAKCPDRYCAKKSLTPLFCSQTRAHACMHTHSLSLLMFPEGGAGLKNIRNFSSQIQFLLMLTSLTPWPFQVGVLFLESALNG